jgi:hypothetical protein
MKKLVLTVFATCIALSLATPVTATQTPKSLVIIDTGISSQVSSLKGSLIDEACFIEFGKCPNGLNNMFGLGAATIEPSLVKDRTLSHGTQMTSVALQIDPTLKVVMIRVVGLSAKGFANTYRTGVITKALEWVNQNANRLNVGAVSISLGRAYSQSQCPIESDLQQQVIDLAIKDIPVIAAAGNGSSRVKIDYPACIPQVIAIGATDTRYSSRGTTGWIYPVMAISNSSADLDYFTLGRFETTNIFGEKSVQLGTSVSTVAFASQLVKLQNNGVSPKDLMTFIDSNLENAYRSMSEVSKKQYSILK